MNTLLLRLEGPGPSWFPWDEGSRGIGETVRIEEGTGGKLGTRKEEREREVKDWTHDELFSD